MTEDPEFKIVLEYYKKFAGSPKLKVSVNLPSSMKANSNFNLLNNETEIELYDNYNLSPK